ncbi:N-acetyltransferase [Microbacterium sp. NPDC077663]|uniref:N-acetyltransferase n=1 Tax=Microbacterium sp. NPDC077663 TaxID=3364189 RepID=UPI0037CCAFF6
MAFPADMVVSAGRHGADFLLRPIGEDDVERDFAAVVASRVDLRLWEQSGWPSDDFTVDDNRADVAGMIERHEAGRAFTYTVADPDDRVCLGCVYVFPTEATFLTRADVRQTGSLAWADVDAVVYFWVLTSWREQGGDVTVVDELRRWFREEWRLSATVYVAHESFVAQIALLEDAGLRPAFEIREHDKPGAFIAHV